LPYPTTGALVERYRALVMLAAISLWSTALLGFLLPFVLVICGILELIVFDSWDRRQLARASRRARLWEHGVVTPLLFLAALLPLSFLLLPLAVVYGLPAWAQLLAALPMLAATLGLLLLVASASAPVQRRRARAAARGLPPDPREEFASSVLRDLEALPLTGEDELSSRQ